MRKTFLLTSILLLSASWALAQYSSGSSATDQNTSGSQSTGAYSGSSSQTSDEMSPGAQPSASDSVDQSSQSSSSVQSSSDQSAPQSGGGYTQSQTGSDMTSQSSVRAAGGTTSGRLKTFQGCLSEENGTFHLTDKMGTSYALSGKTANLKGHVGHTVAITGKASRSGESQPGAMSGEQAGMEQTIRVSSFRHISTSCNTSMHTHSTR